MTDSLKYSIEDIKHFIVDQTGCKEDEVSATIDIDSELGCTGDDFDELIGEYASKFKVNMDGYLWYFHTYEEGYGIGNLFFKAPNDQVKHIPVMPVLLLESANAGKWILTYPEHSLPQRRYDTLVNQVVILLFLMFFIYKCSSR